MATTTFIVLWMLLIALCFSQQVIKNATEDDPLPIFELESSETTDGWLKQMQGIQWSI